MQKTLPLLLGLFVLAACTVPPPPARKTSNVAAPTSVISLAQQAVARCGNTMPDIDETAKALRNAGFVDTQTRFAGSAFELDEPGGNIRVQLGQRPAGGGRFESVCLIAVAGMTPDQSFSLVQPWVRQYGAITNAEAGQGLSAQAVQAWRSEKPERIVFLAALKANKSIRQPGASARLIIIE